MARNKGTVRLFVPRSDETVRPFDLSVNDVDVLVELKPEGRTPFQHVLGIHIPLPSSGTCPEGNRCNKAEIKCSGE